MSNELQEGTSLTAIHTLSTPAYEGISYVVCEEGDIAMCTPCQKITVKMQRGQMSMVPWAEVVLKTDVVLLVNLANVESVELDL